MTFRGSLKCGKLFMFLLKIDVQTGNFLILVGGSVCGMVLRIE